MQVRTAIEVRLAQASKDDVSTLRVRLPQRLKSDKTSVRIAMFQRLAASRLFAYGDRAKPEPFAGLEAMIREAGAYAMVSPEYNHSMSPALGDLLNHFPSSAFAFKPSLIATYSSGQWGGTRAAVNMRTFLSELGCLPVSAMLHFPHADQVFEADGQFHPEQDAGKWKTYVDRGVGQLQWWADAADRHRGILDPAGVSKAFSKTPAERDSPGR